MGVAEGSIIPCSSAPELSRCSNSYPPDVCFERPQSKRLNILHHSLGGTSSTCSAILHLIFRRVVLQPRSSSWNFSCGARLVRDISIAICFVLTRRVITDGPPPSPVIPGCNLTGGNAIFAGIPFVIVLLNDTRASLVFLPTSIHLILHSHYDVHAVDRPKKLSTLEKSLNRDFVPRRNHILRFPLL
jgi:hypothetical protein